MKTVDLVKKYEIQKEDWEDINLVDVKMKLQTVMALFLAIENTLAELVTPAESDLLENTRDEILKYIEENFIKPQEWDDRY